MTKVGRVNILRAVNNLPGLCLLISLLAFPAHAQEATKRGAAAEGQATHKALLTTEYNKSEDRTTVRIDPPASDPTMNVGDGIVLSAFFRFRGKGIRESVESAALTFSSDSRDWRHIYNRALTVVVDGERILHTDSGRVGQVAEPYDRTRPGRTLYFGVSRGDLEKIADGRVVEMKLGRKSFTLNPGQLEVFRELVGRMWGL